MLLSFSIEIKVVLHAIRMSIYQYDTETLLYRHPPLQGIPGQAGQKGEAGDGGSDGAKGETGVDGVKGEKGRFGVPGAKGPSGPKGEAGNSVRILTTFSCVDSNCFHVMLL